MEAELEKNKENLIKAQEVASIGSWELDIIKNDLWWSDQAYKIFNVVRGVSLMTYENFLAYIHPEDKEFVQNQWLAALNNEPYNIEHRIIVDDTEKWVREMAEVTFNKEGNAVLAVGTVQDITEHKELEENLRQLRSELLHSSRAGTMVELTAALAHELNHPLGSILNNANAAKRYLANKSPDLNEIRDIISDIISEDRRANDVMQKVRALMKNTRIVFVPLNINNIVEDVIKLTKSDLIIKNISLSKLLGNKLPKINGDRIQLQQVFLNLIINATHAIENSSIKSIQISTVKKDNNNIIVCVRDSGTGFNEKDKDSLFKPFFTNKKEGMGMGLSVSKTIIKSHGGDIWAQNNKKNGASFFVSLPYNI
jgi:C4-dicarboxylate-specific signal transduction histidine kinase